MEETVNGWLAIRYNPWSQGICSLVSKTHKYVTYILLEGQIKEFTEVNLGGQSGKVTRRTPGERAS